MLTVTVPEQELWDEYNEIFVKTDPYILRLEHSLVSVAKWEMKRKKPFLSKNEKTKEELDDYIRCMAVDEEPDDDQLSLLTIDNLYEIRKYIDDPMSALYIREGSEASSRTVITSDVIYYWMIALNIPFECQYWHFNRLLALIHLCNNHNKKPSKASERELSERYHSINAERLRKYNTSG